MTAPNLVSVYSARNLREAMFVQLSIEARGIEVVQRGADLTAYVGQEEGMVLRDLLVPEDRAGEARQAIEEWLASRDGDRPPQPTWSCPSCGEENVLAFQVCWRCGEPPAP